MATQLGELYSQLKQSFTSQPSDLQKCGQLLAKLKVSFAPTADQSVCILRTKLRLASFKLAYWCHKAM